LVTTKAAAASAAAALVTIKAAAASAAAVRVLTLELMAIDSVSYFLSGLDRLYECDSNRGCLWTR
jgi:hypothetical protein